MTRLKLVPQSAGPAPRAWGVWPPRPSCRRAGPRREPSPQPPSSSARRSRRWGTTGAPSARTAAWVLAGRAAPLAAACRSGPWPCPRRPAAPAPDGYPAALAAQRSQPSTAWPGGETGIRTLEPLRVHMISNHAPSATRSSLRSVELAVPALKRDSSRDPRASCTAAPLSTLDKAELSAPCAAESCPSGRRSLIRNQVYP